MFNIDTYFRVFRIHSEVSLKSYLVVFFQIFFGDVAHLAIKHLGFSLVQTKFHLGPDVLEIALDREIINCHM